MFLGVVGKIGAFLVIIPKPVIGGAMLVILGSVVGVLLAELNQYDMKRPRNYMTVGLSILLGFMIPQLIIRNPDRINTGEGCVQIIREPLNLTFGIYPCMSNPDRAFCIDDNTDS